MTKQESSEAVASDFVNSWLSSNGIPIPEKGEEAPSNKDGEEANEGGSDEKSETNVTVPEDESGTGDDNNDSGGKKDESSTEDEDVMTFETFLNAQKEKEVKFSKPTPFSDSQYEFNEDGAMVVKDELLASDIKEIDENPALIHRFANSKKKHMQEKGDFIAEKILGYKADNTRSAGRVASDTIKAYTKILESEGEAEANKFAEEHFPDGPDWIPEGLEDQILFDIPGKEGASHDEDSNSSEIIRNDVQSFVDEYFEESDQVEALEEIMTNKDIFEAVSKPRYNQETGKALTYKEKLVELFESIEAEKVETVGSGKLEKDDASKDNKEQEEESPYSDLTRDFIKNNINLS